MARQTTAVRSADEVAAILGVTQQNVSRIEANAMRKLQEAFAGDMDDYLPTTSICTGRWNRRRIVRVCR
jgi:predicted DNA-binding protein